VGAGANTTLLSDTLWSKGLAECAAARSKVWLRKKTVDLCACESEQREHGVGADVNAIVMSDVLYGIGLANLLLLHCNALPNWQKKQPRKLFFLKQKKFLMHLPRFRLRPKSFRYPLRSRDDSDAG
jgi:hypothetical protein